MDFAVFLFVFAGRWLPQGVAVGGGGGTGAADAQQESSQEVGLPNYMNEDGTVKISPGEASRVCIYLASDSSLHLTPAYI